MRLIPQVLKKLQTEFSGYYKGKNCFYWVNKYCQGELMGSVSPEEASREYTEKGKFLLSPSALQSPYPAPYW